MKKRIVVASLIATQLTGAFSAEPQTAHNAAPAPAPRPILTDDAIKDAISKTLAESREMKQRRHEADTLRANKYEAFSQEFAEAKLPDCLGPDGLKHQPPVIGPIAFVGLYAIPFVVLAKLRGKCL